jgi:membrane protein implicated in regulation of membrane protease activity
MSRDRVPNNRYEVTYQAVRNAILSVLETATLGLVLFLIGIFGLGILGATGIAFYNETTTQSTFFAALFGVAVVVFAVYELYHLRSSVV